MKLTVKRYHVLFLLVVVGSLVVCAADDCFNVTQLDSCWLRQCRRGQFISSLDSVYHSSHSDRTWTLCCRNLPTGTALSMVTCQKWTGFQNEYRANLNFVCPNNGYIYGIASCLTNLVDRTYSFKCCQGQGSVMQSCENWGVNNMFQARSTFTVEPGRVLTGMNAFYNTRFRDRVYENTDCLLSTI